MINIKKILLPTDLSDPAEAALPYAVDLAASYGATLYLLHVLDPYWLEAVAAVQFPGHSAKSLHQSWKNTDERLNKMKAGIGVAKVEAAEVQGTAHVEIVRFARQENIDLIVLSTHGRSGLAHALIGSVAEKVVQMAPCPVLTVKHPDHKFVMP